MNLLDTNDNSVPIQSLCLYVDRFNPPYAGLIQNMLSICEKYDITVRSASPSADHLSSFDIQESDLCDMAIVLGGDGSILRGMDYYRTLGIPVLGINAGHLGFLASVEQVSLEETIARIAQGDYTVEALPILRAKFPSGHYLTAVNDFSINRSMMGGILHFDLLVDDARVAHMVGDGIVVSTPLGSTAYGLSCGGPILDPGLPAILIVPICPHSLSLRPLVVPDDLSVSIKIGTLRGTGPVVSADGATSGTLRAGEILTVTKDSSSCMIVRFSDHPGYYDKLGLKLGWGSRG
ncbi:MAG: NAD(+)/NADH kinase [Candidatus Aegiribacteria sp.]|nr:NAD(+)/NADH kinase [Candidatus Aegiribacteria sp.]